MGRRIGILGGTFDPIHVGHLIIGQEVLDRCNLELLIFLPSGEPPHKQYPEMAVLAATADVPIVLMHNQNDTNYKNMLLEVLDGLRDSVNQAMDSGVPSENIILDPGLGFGKKPEHNLEILRRLEEFQVLGLPLLVGTSRKSTIGLVLDLPVEERLEGTAATVAIAIANGADIVRVHDVKSMARVARMSDAVVRGWQNQ